MAGPVDSYVQLPSDASNTGKKNRTQTKVVGSNTVHEHYMVPSPGFTRTGRYMACSTAAQLVSSTSQSGTGSGFYYLHNSTANTAVCILRHVEMNYSQEGTAVITQSAPLFSLQKYTFNTAHSATTVNIVSAQTSSTTPKANVRTAPTGATITLVGPIASQQLPALVSTAGVYGGTLNMYDSRYDNYNRGAAVEFGPGEGIVLFQYSTGNAADTRRFTAKFAWDEIDVS